MDREYQEATGFRVGFKPAGGIRTAKDAIAWLVLIKVCMSLCFFVSLFVFAKYIFSGGTGGLLAEQQDVQVIPTIMTSCQRFMHFENNYIYNRLMTFSALFYSLPTLLS